MKAAGKLHDKAHDAAAFATGRRVHTRSRLGFGARRRVGLFLLIGQKRSAQSQSGGAMSIGHEAEVTNAMEAVRQGVQQEATNELVGGQLHDLCRVVVSVILPGEPDMIVVDLDDAAIGDGDAVRVAPEIGEHLGRTAEWFFGVDDPVDASCRCEQRMPTRRVGEGCEFAEEVQPAEVEGLLQAFEEQPAKEPRQRFDREEEIGTSRDPAGSIG